MIRAAGSPEKLMAQMDVGGLLGQVANAAKEGNYEKAHAKEDEMHVKALELIIKYGDNFSKDLAIMALRSKDWEFPRHAA